MSNAIVYYHDQCRDGFISAWNMKNLFKSSPSIYGDNVNYIPVRYGDNSSFVIPSKNHDKQLYTDFYFVDFVPAIEMIDPLVKMSDEYGGHIDINIVDHHVDNIYKFLSSLVKYNTDNFSRYGSPKEFQENAFKVYFSMFNKDGTSKSIENAKTNSAYDKFEIRNFMWFDEEGNHTSITFSFTVSMNNTFSGGALTLFEWLSSAIHTEKFKIMNFVANSFPNEGRKLSIKRFFNVSEKEANIIKLSLHVSDGDLYNWKFENSEEFLVALNDEIVKRNFDFEECCKYLDDLVEDNDKFNELYYTGQMKLGPLKQFVELHSNPIGFICPCEIHENEDMIMGLGDFHQHNARRMPIYVIDKGAVSKLSHLVTATRGEYETVFIISSYDTDKGVYHTRVGSNTETAREIAQFFNGGGHPNAAGCELKMECFTVHENAVIQSMVRERKWLQS